MYIRHYITKSFDEYLWKLNTRGMFYKHHRDINEFFVYNPEMQNNPEIKRLIENKEEINMSFYQTADKKYIVVYNGQIEGYADSLPDKIS